MGGDSVEGFGAPSQTSKFASTEQIIIATKLECADLYRKPSLQEPSLQDRTKQFTRLLKIGISLPLEAVDPSAKVVVFMAT